MRSMHTNCMLECLRCGAGKSKTSFENAIFVLFVGDLLFYNLLFELTFTQICSELPGFGHTRLLLSTVADELQVDFELFCLLCTIIALSCGSRYLV